MIKAIRKVQNLLSKYQIYINKKLLILSLSSSLLLAQNELEGITVTDSKLSNTEINSSSSVDIISKKEIEDTKINNIEDISSLISNVNISGLGNRSDKTFTFRGISNYVSYESSVAVYIDNIPIPFSYGYSAFNMNNIQNIEILKGPQGTLFGKNSQAGLINIQTKPTSKVFQSEASVDIASKNSKNIYGRVSGPAINKDITYAISIASDTSDGYTKNELTNSHFDKRDLKSFSSKINYEINDNTNATLTYIKTKTDDGGSPFKMNTKENPFSIDNHPNNDFVKMNNDLASIVITNENENYKFTSSTTYAKQDILRETYTNTFGGLLLDFDIDIEEISQEFRLNYNYDKFDFLIGAFYSDKLKFDYKEDQTFQNIAALNNTNNIQNKDQNKALFSQARYWIKDNYAITLGGRYQEIKRDFSRELSSSSALNQGQAIKTWSYFTPSVSFLYYGESDFNIYATYSKSFLPGGYNYRQTTNALTPYKEETTDSFEIGYKSNFKDFTFETALFYNDITNHKINTFNDYLGTVTLNADKSYSYGSEVSLKYNSEKIDIFSNLGLIKSKIKEFEANKKYEGKNAIDVPQITANLGAKYKIDKNYYIQSNLNYMGKRYYNISNSSSLSGFATVNAGLGYKNKDLDILLYSNNLLDKEYSDFIISSPSNEYYHFGKPRVIGIKLSMNF